MLHIHCLLWRQARLHIMEGVTYHACSIKSSKAESDRGVINVKFAKVMRPGVRLQSSKADFLTVNNRTILTMSSVSPTVSPFGTYH